MAETWVSNGTRRMLAPTPLANHQLARLLDTMSDGERKSFWVAVAIIDGKVTAEQVINARAGRTRLSVAASPAPARRRLPAAARTKLGEQVRYCEADNCGKPLPAQATGRPRRFHDECRAHRRAQLRAVC